LATKRMGRGAFADAGAGAGFMNVCVCGACQSCTEPAWDSGEEWGSRRREDAQLRGVVRGLRTIRLGKLARPVSMVAREGFKKTVQRRSALCGRKSVPSHDWLTTAMAWSLSSREAQTQGVLGSPIGDAAIAKVHAEDASSFIRYVTSLRPRVTISNGVNPPCLGNVEVDGDSTGSPSAASLSAHKRITARDSVASPLRSWTAASDTRPISVRCTRQGC